MHEHFQGPRKERSARGGMAERCCREKGRKSVVEYRRQACVRYKRLHCTIRKTAISPVWFTTMRDLDFQVYFSSQWCNQCLRIFIPSPFISGDVDLSVTIFFHVSFFLLHFSPSFLLSQYFSCHFIVHSLLIFLFLLFPCFFSSLSLFVLKDPSLRHCSTFWSFSSTLQFYCTLRLKSCRMSRVTLLTCGSNYPWQLSTFTRACMCLYMCVPGLI